MLKAILSCWILSAILYTKPICAPVYTVNLYKHGTPYIRLTIPESSLEWTCFDPNMYEKFLELSVDQPVKDSEETVTEEQLRQCQENQKDLDTSYERTKANVNILKVAGDTVLMKYKTNIKEVNQQLATEKFKKYYWGFVGAVAGSVIGMIFTIFMIK